MSCKDEKMDSKNRTLIDISIQICTRMSILLLWSLKNKPCSYFWSKWNWQGRNLLLTWKSISEFLLFSYGVVRFVLSCLFIWSFYVLSKRSLLHIWKKAFLNPIQKKENRSVVENYRTMSFLRNWSILLKKIISSLFIQNFCEFVYRKTFKLQTKRFQAKLSCVS